MMTIILIIAVLLAIVTGVQLLKIAELRAKNKGELIYEVKERDGKIQATLVFAFLFAYMASFFYV